MKRLRIILPILAFVIAATTAVAAKNLFALTAYYKIDTTCHVCQVHNSCTLTEPGIRCLCFFSGDPAFQDPDCLIELYRPKE